MTQKQQFPDVQSITDQINENLKKLNITEIDAGALVEEQYKNIEAIFSASNIANKGAYAVAERQLELFRDTSKQLLSLFSETKLTPQERADIAKKTYETALTGSREAAEMASKASEAAFAVARERLTQGFEQFKKRTSQKA